MNPNSHIYTAVISLLLGLAFAVYMDRHANLRYNKTNEMLAKCEESLPRNQKCKLVAIPEN